jgi:anti-sigma factor RsiW
LTYETTVELLSRLLDGDLTPAERRRAEVLIADDGAAREIYLGLRRVRGALGELAEAEPPGHLGAFIERRVALEAKRSRPWTSADRGLRRFLVEPSMLPALAVLLALAAMIYLLVGGLHRFERAHEPRILRPPPTALRLPAPRQVGGRTFSFAGDRWIEAGVSAEEAARAPRLRVRADEVDAWMGARPELEGLEELGAVVIDLDGEVVEVVFE